MRYAAISSAEGRFHLVPIKEQDFIAIPSMLAELLKEPCMQKRVITVSELNEYLKMLFEYDELLRNIYKGLRKERS